MSTNISKKLQNTQMERTQKSRFPGCLLLTLCHLMANYSYIHLAPRPKEMQRSDVRSLHCSETWSSALTTLNKYTQKHREQTQISNQRREIQKEAKQLGLKDAMKVQGLWTNQSVTEDTVSASPWDRGKTQNQQRNIFGQISSSDLKVLHSFSLENGY